MWGFLFFKVFMFMNYQIKKEQLQSIFDSMMKEFENLEYTDRSYDYWDSLKSRYVDDNVTNFYKNIDEDYDDDNWIFQYQKTPGDSATKYEVPVLRCSETSFI
jgi:hypothetical protein